MTLSLPRKPSALARSRRTINEAQDGPNVTSVGSNTEEPCDRDKVVARAITSPTARWQSTNGESPRSPGRVEHDLTDLIVPQALGREPDRHPSLDFDLPGRKLNVQEAARLLGLSVSTLNKMRLTGSGPPYLKLGRRVVYDVHDLEAWAASRKRNHTSE